MSLHRVLLDILDDSIGGEDWIDDAVCSQMDPEIFFGVEGKGAHEAKRVCNTLCGVREQCLEWALEVEAGLHHGLRHGVYGGTSAFQRAKMDKARRAEAA